ncbi:MAG: ROK family protein [Candidatus Neomarinimicrobiota bacterium]|jgi:fructokinase|nr:ROK family protein [Candidatus Neomarinimicrobiota bacterium]MEC9474650.1 ROK family protein [Candidatus Neomarinimicrobiota bacterium]
MAYRLGIDLGGTKIEAILIDDQFQVVERKRVPTMRDDGYGAILKRIIDLAKDMMSTADVDGPIGICTPGAIEPKTGLLKNSNTVCLIGQPIQKDMEAELKIPVLMENDANCFALAEATIGAAKKYNVVFGVILGTGCGGGISIHKNIHRGANRIAGEWGHHTLYPDGRDCYCGNKGCTESYISGTALEQEWQELSGTFSRVTDVIDNKLYESHPEWKSNFILNFGRAMANVIDILDPDAIVLGGGLSKIDFLYTDGKESAYSETFSEIVSTPILKNKLGDSGGVFGAAMLADHI